MQPVEPILTTDLFPELHSHLMQMLKELADEEWHAATICTPWTVKDVAAHLLDTNIRRLSSHRDQNSLHLAEAVMISGHKELVDFLDQLNHLWVKAAQRIGPPLLIEFLDLTGQQVYQFFKTLDPYAPAKIPVAWAGEEVSLNWFDVAREYTEKWLHQQQIRDALGRPDLYRRYQLYPVLDTFLRALPFAYRNIETSEGTGLSVVISGEAGGTWSLVREQGTWCLFYGHYNQATARVNLDQDTAWRLFTKGLSPEEARNRLQIEGETALGSGILHMVSIMA